MAERKQKFNFLKTNGSKIDGKKKFIKNQQFFTLGLILGAKTWQTKTCFLRGKSDITLKSQREQQLSVWQCFCLEGCRSGRTGVTGDHVFVKSEPRVRIPPLPPMYKIEVSCHVPPVVLVGCWPGSWKK